MKFITSRQARSEWGDVLNQVEHGVIITITRHGKQMARIVPCEPQSQRNVFPDMSKFRSTIKVKGESTSKVISQMRHEERF